MREREIDVPLRRGSVPPAPPADVTERALVHLGTAPGLQLLTMLPVGDLLFDEPADLSVEGGASKVRIGGFVRQSGNDPGHGLPMA